MTTLLCADSGSQRLVVAVVQDGKVLAQADSVAQAAHGVAILELCERVTEQAGLPHGAVDALVVALGPGSFTGLRTSLSTFKGLAMGWQKPLVGVSTFLALARSAADTPGARVACCLDARKGEVYGAVVELGDKITADHLLTTPCAMKPAEFAASVQALPGLTWAGDGPARFPQIFGGLVEGCMAWPDAVPSMTALAACALPSLPHGDDLSLLEPLYVRRTATELSLGPAVAPRP